MDGPSKEAVLAVSGSMQQVRWEVDHNGAKSFLNYLNFSFLMNLHAIYEEGMLR